MGVWSRRQSPMGGYYEFAVIGGRTVVVRQTVNHRWVVRVDGRPAGGSFGSADAARVAAERLVRS